MDPEPISQHKEKTSKAEQTIASREFSIDYTNEKKEEQKILQEILELKQSIHKLNMKSDGIVLHKHVQTIVNHLRDQEIAQEHLDNLVMLLVETIGETNPAFEDVYTLTSSYLRKHLPVASTSLFQKKYVNVVGPTGVGKTTTIAKLAAEMVLKHFKKVAFITTDTYRIAAIEQLKTYSSILNVPIEVAYNTEDFLKAIEKFAHYDTVFIDTAGRNFRNKEYVEDLQRFISFDDEMETYLVLSVTSKQRDMEEILRQFSLIPISCFIFTKIDETASFGAVYNMMSMFQMDTAYITNGQNVPDDIVKMTPDKIIETLLEDLKHERSS